MTGTRTAFMIYGPQDDGTYVVEFRTADGDALAILIPRRGARDPALPRANAVWTVRPLRSYVTLTARDWRAGEPPLGRDRHDEEGKAKAAGWSSPEETRA